MDRRGEILETRVPRRSVTIASGLAVLVREACGLGESREVFLFSDASTSVGLLGQG